MCLCDWKGEGKYEQEWDSGRGGRSRRMRTKPARHLRQRRWKSLESGLSELSSTGVGGGCGIRKARHRDAQRLRMLRLTCESRKQKMERVSNKLQAAGQRSKNEQRRDRDATLKGLRTRESGTGTKRGASSGLRHHSDVSPGSIGRFWRGRGDGERGARDVFLCWLRIRDT